MKTPRTVLGGVKRADLESLFTLAYSLRDPHRLVVMAVALVAVTGFAVLDYVSGPWVGFGVFYALIVMGATFHAGWVAGAILAILSSGAGLSARIFYSSGDLSVAAALWNLGNELAVFFALVLLLHHGRSLLDRLASQSRMDLLTGALNTRGVLEAFERERARARRTGSPLTLAFFDVDNMKRVNDELGHAEGDEMLRILGASVKAAIRPSDVFGRVGGDEFALILSDTDPHGAQRAIQRLRNVMNRRSRSRWPYISLSVGVVTFQGDPPEAGHALQIADALMYLAKRAGGNRMAGRVLAGGETPEREFGLVFDLADHQPWRTGRLGGRDIPAA